MAPPPAHSSQVEVVDLDSTIESEEYEKEEQENHPERFAPVRPGGQKLDRTIELSSSDDEDHEVKDNMKAEERIHGPELGINGSRTLDSSTSDSGTNPNQSTRLAADSSGALDHANSSPNQTAFMTPCQTPAQLQSHSDVVSGARVDLVPWQTSTPFGGPVKSGTGGVSAATAFTPSASSFHFVKDPGHANPFQTMDEIRDEFHQTDPTLPDPSDEGDDEAEEDSAIASAGLDLHSPLKRPPALRPHDSSSSGEYTDEDRPGSDLLISPPSGALGSGSPLLVHHRRQPTPKKRKLADLDLPETCTVLHMPDGAGSVYLVGTAHFSEQSQEDVARVIRQVQPDVVMLELCKTRSSMLHMDEARILAESASMTPAKMRTLIREKGLASGMLYILMLSLSAKLTRELGMIPGGEFRRAFNEARKIPGCMIHLGDRPIDITMKRAMGSLTLWQKIRFSLNVLFSSETVTKEDVEKCKQKDLLATIMVELAGEYPELSNVILNERDLFLAFSLRTAVQSRRIIMENQMAHNQQASHPVVVGVVGIGHVAGIQANFETVSAEDISRLVQLPVPTFAQIALSKTLRFGFYLSLTYGGYRLLRGPICKFLTH
ncbi:hypothetical protein TCAL_12141 [Tigriopus californicus]|uniref:TraB domain-containing protein n=1 Tax=Tigriopus californicus TaxID=6832 RepID=A0A553PD95_TIGCA|nr:uncharacterized protein LOC131893234 [Tigriopus californicus]TRY75646.1 hypothetical protein TCAL_12141 [Tigriopus californicus]